MALVNDIRERFLTFFEKRGHTRVPSSALIPANDPTLLFTNAGMVQFKNVFTGIEKKPYATAVTAQKCVRAGGKHNDLDNVGYTARHHTFFEMLGNFSFGHYFKEQAILYAWDFLTKEMGVARDRLVVTVYHTDDDAYTLWRKISGLPDSKIIRIASDDNFWSMGETGPCGPCSEIFFDHGPSFKGMQPGSGADTGDRFVEIWNLVFMQFEQLDPKTRRGLPQPSIDTGMGLERFSAVVQGVHDNYDIDTFRTLIAASAELSGVGAQGSAAISHRIMADHLRSSAFLIADGVIPTNEGRGYVLRRIMRRAMRHASMLGVKDPFLWRLVPTLVREMGQAYPELVRAETLVTETLKLEEGRFRSLLETGLSLLSKETKKIKAGAMLSGEVAFRLYDTYGFPLDLTQEALRAQGLSVDTAGFDTAMAQQRERARASWKGSGELATEQIWFDLKERFGSSDFLGYQTERAEGKALAVLKDGREVQTAQVGDEVIVVANQTPFYGEGGGQVGDTGSACTVNGATVDIVDTQKKLASLIVHKARVMTGSLQTGDTLVFTVNGERRARIRANHSVTHLLHRALRARLGAHVTQKGSLVAEHYLRFDIAHPRQISKEELATIESDVNALIRQNSEVTTRLMSQEQALQEGAVALFGEKYGDEVRVVSMGWHTDTVYSLELCGGTHVHRTGDIALFAITAESSVASGIRRIEALTGEAARQHLIAQAEQLREAATLLKVPVTDVTSRITTLLSEKRKLEDKLRTGAASVTLDIQTMRTINKICYLSQVLTDASADQLRQLVEQTKKRMPSGVIALVGVNEGKASVVVGVSADLTAKMSAIDLVKRAADILGGSGGGGRAELAQAGGPRTDQAQKALNTLENYIKKII